VHHIALENQCSPIQTQGALPPNSAPPAGLRERRSKKICDELKFLRWYEVFCLIRRHGRTFISLFIKCGGEYFIYK
jgi:hypothetical protein